MTSLVPRAGEPAMRVRALRFEEVPEALRLIRRAVEAGCRVHYDAQQRQVVYASYASALFGDTWGPFETLAAEQAGELVGVAQLHPADERLRALFVDGDRQGRGLGRALLAEVEVRARQHGCRRLRGAMALNAVGFYRRAGFEERPGPERLLDKQVVVPVVRMEKILTPVEPPVLL